MPRTPSYGGGTSNMTMSSAWSARTPPMSPACTASAQVSINVRICLSSSVIRVRTAPGRDSDRATGSAAAPAAPPLPDLGDDQPDQEGRHRQEVGDVHQPVSGVGEVHRLRWSQAQAFAWDS